jgi:archaellin
VRQTDDDYRDAEVRAYQSMGIGCLLVAIALIITAGVAVWIVIWYVNTLTSFFLTG